MSLCSTSLVRLGNLGFLSVGVIAFALVTLQGCAAPAVTASSLKEPGAPVVGLGALRADEPTRTTTIPQPAERAVAVRASHDHERGFRNYNCRRFCQ
jgi:hypothetical protein